MIKNPKVQQGYMVMLSVILLSVIGLSIAVSLVLLGLANSDTSFAERQSLQANALALACAETALENLREDAGYAGGAVLSLGAGSCNLSPIILDAGAYTIQTSGSVGAVVRRISIQAQRQDGPPAKMQIITWQEVASF